MNELQVFSNVEFGDIRSMMIDEAPWFVGKDVCQAFGDTNHNRSLGRIDSEDKRTVEIDDAYGRKQSAIFINESGLYSLLFAMQPQKAHSSGVRDEYPTKVQGRIEKLHKFKHWVTSEVLPAIRKTGTYTNPQAEHIDPQEEAYTGAQRLGDVVELAKLTARLMKDNKHRPADILQTVGEQLEQFGVPIPEGFFLGSFTSEGIDRSNTVAAFLAEYGDVTGEAVIDVYDAYLNFCSRTGNRPIPSTRGFGSEIVKQTGIHTKPQQRNGKVIRVYMD